MNIKRYNQFINESSLVECVDNIIKFLYDNGVANWNEFVNMSPTQRSWVNKIIDHSAKNTDDLNEIRFQIRMSLCDDIIELKSMLADYESNEEYERCGKIKSKIQELTNG